MRILNCTYLPILQDFVFALCSRKSFCPLRLLDFAKMWKIQFEIQKVGENEIPHPPFHVMTCARFELNFPYRVSMCAYVAPTQKYKCDVKVLVTLRSIYLVLNCKLNFCFNQLISCKNSILISPISCRSPQVHASRIEKKM